MAALLGAQQLGSAMQRPTAASQRACSSRAFTAAAAAPATCGQRRQRRCCRVVVVRASADEDAELEQRLAALRRGKGATPDGEGSKARKRAEADGKPPKQQQQQQAAAAPAYDYTSEELHWEGGPAAGDLAFNVALGATLVALPLTVGALTRGAFVRYRFTDRRVSVISKAPWETKQTDCAYQEVREVRTVSRGLGAWGDMVIELKNGDKLELRSLEKFRELRDYVLARRDALTGGTKAARRAAADAALMDLDISDEEALARSSKAKGFS